MFDRRRSARDRVQRLADVTRIELVSLVDRKAAELRKAGATRKWFWRRRESACRCVGEVLCRLCRQRMARGFASDPVAKACRRGETRARAEPVELGEAWIALQDAQRDGSMPVSYARVLALLDAHRRPRFGNYGLATGRRRPRRRLAYDRGGQDSGVASRAAPPGGGGRCSLNDRGMDADAPTPCCFRCPEHEARSRRSIFEGRAGLVKRLGHKRWTPHDLRRILTTGLHELGVDGDVARRIAGHVGPDIHASVYDRSKPDREDSRMLWNCYEGMS